MLGELRVNAGAGLIAGEPGIFSVVFTSASPVLPGGLLRLLYDRRGCSGKESLAQVSDPGAANYVAAGTASGAPARLRVYSVDHSYKPIWTPEPECYRWVDLLGPDVSLNCHVVEALFESGLAAGDPVTFRFGAVPQGFLLTPKSYARFPIWAIADPSGSGRWQAAGVSSVEVMPGTAVRAVVTAPSICRTGETLRPRTRFFDKHSNPVPEPPSGFARAAGGGYAAKTVGVHRAAPGELKGLPVASNPTLVTDEPLRRRLYWGDLHGHCNVCDGGVRSPEEYYEWARDAMDLDFCALTAHDFGIALGDAEARWGRLQSVAAAFDEPGRFAAMLGWEATHIGFPRGQAVGHKNILFRGGQAPFFNGSMYAMPRVRVDYGSYAELRRLLRGLECLVIPHHPLNPVRTGGLGTNWGEFWPARERVVEIHSLWGTSEGMDSPARTVDAVEGTSVLTALMRGYRLGFVGGSDTHDGRPANPSEPWTPGAKTGLTAVWTPRLSRAAVYDALRQRRCYATTGARIILDSRVGGLTMGQRRLVAAGDPLLAEREIRVFVAGTATIRKVEVVRDGQTVHTMAGTGDTLREMWADRSPLQSIAMSDQRGRRFAFYYVRVEQEDGNRAWASPVWLDLTQDA